MPDNVVPLFKAPPDVADVPPPVDLALVPDHVPTRWWSSAGRFLRAAATHKRVGTIVRPTVRHSAYLLGGVRILTRRAWDDRTTARYARMIRGAEAAGNYEEIKEWEKRAAAFRKARHKRRMDLLKAMLYAPKAIAYGTAAAAGALLVLGIILAVASKDVGLVLAPIATVIQLIGWIAFIVGFIWNPLLIALPFLAIGSIWNVGRQRQAAPRWALPVEEKRDVVPDEGAILHSLKHLSIPKLNQAFKDGWQPRWSQGTVRLGNGYHSRLQLPMGVTVEMINGKKPVLAHNLLRLPIEVWPTEPRDQPGILDLWVADQGSLSGKVPDWPLLTEGTTDYFKGVPVGVSQRGDTVHGKLMASNYMVGGIMGSGKSSLVVSLLLGAMLDPLVEIDVYVMAFNVDYDPMKRRLNTLVKGDDDEQIEAAVKALRNLRGEVTERGKLLEAFGGDEVRLTRELAERDPRMRPKVVVFDECHELFMHKKYGAEAAELAEQVMKKARKVGITLIWVTVSPTADSIPKEVTRNTSHRVAFAVGDHIANDGLLGTGKHRAGITATNLNPAEDIGTCLTVGFTRNNFELVRAHYVRKDAERDQITPVVERAMGLREGITPAPAQPVDEPVDHLADIVAVVGDVERPRTDVVRQLLAERNPAEYRSWTASELTRVLQEVGAAPYKSGGVMVVSRDRVRAALRARDDDTSLSDAE
ncbi:cell division protein FtsK [Streptomyces sp. A7024]|uniref:Cell division protein FtsK n=1 Tax=Streptomyces coryli TaxID=1128680 RepID=A0A6G4TWF6_9ACTN|nr:FtsK/SpoIIIE domain-containing protein [Streptomyces coryli]NGN64112.1 cell division protein FtsK [Streptomyces coryli]